MTRPDRVGVEAALAALPLWSATPGREAIERRFVFADFATAFAFMAHAAAHAESMNHHPEWFNVWRRVDVTLTTHDAGGVTALDLELARRMDAFAARLGVSS